MEYLLSGPNPNPTLPADICKPTKVCAIKVEDVVIDEMTTDGTPMGPPLVVGVVLVDRKVQVPTALLDMLLPCKLIQMGILSPEMS